MLDSITSDVLVSEVTQPEVEQKKNKNISYRGTDFERTPDSDSFEGEKKNNTGKIIGIIAGALAVVALTIGTICYSKGKGADGVEKKFSECMKDGWNKLWHKGEENAKQAANEVENITERAIDSASETAVNTENKGIGTVHTADKEINKVDFRKINLTKEEQAVKEKIEKGYLLPLPSGKPCTYPLTKLEIANENLTSSIRQQPQYKQNIEYAQRQYGETVLRQEEELKAIERQNSDIRNTEWVKNKRAEQAKEYEAALEKELDAIEKRKIEQFNLFNYKDIAFEDIPGYREGKVFIDHRDADGKLIRRIFKKEDNAIEVAETNGQSLFAAKRYFIRDGKVIEMSLREKENEVACEMANALVEIKEQISYQENIYNSMSENEVAFLKKQYGDAVQRYRTVLRETIDSYARKCGMLPVNNTVKIGDETVNVIYEGFDIDITSDGKILTKQFVKGCKRWINETEFYRIIYQNNNRTPQAWERSGQRISQMQRVLA